MQLGGVEDHPYFTTFEDGGNTLKHSLGPNIDETDPILLNGSYDTEETKKLPHYRFILNKEKDLTLAL